MWKLEKEANEAGLSLIGVSEKKKRDK